MGADPDKVPQLAFFDANEEKQYTATVLPELTKQFAPVVASVVRQTDGALSDTSP